MLVYTLPAAGIGGSGQAFGTIELPLGLPGYSGAVQMTVLNIERVPPLTPIGLLTKLKTDIALGHNKMTFGNNKQPR